MNIKMNHVRMLRHSLLLACTLALTGVSQAAPKKGDLVEVTSYSISDEARVLAEKDGKYLVRYEMKDLPDEWVEAERISLADKGNTKAGPPPGTYDCYFPMYEHTYMGSFVLAGKTYRYLTGDKGKGAWKYDPKTRKVSFLSGPLAKKGISGEFENTKRNGPIIVITFPKGKRKGDFQNALWRGKK
jgi:hypothetical protein